MVAVVAHPCATCGAMGETPFCTSCGLRRDKPSGMPKPNPGVAAAHIAVVFLIGWAVGTFAWEALGRPTAWLNGLLIDVLPVSSSASDPATCATDGSLAAIGCQARAVGLASLGIAILTVVVLTFRRTIATALRLAGSKLPRLIRPVVGPVVAIVMFTMAYSDLHHNALAVLGGQSPIPDAAIPAAVGVMSYLAVAIAARSTRKHTGLLTTLARVPAPLRLLAMLGLSLALAWFVGSSQSGGLQGVALREQLIVVGSAVIAAVLVAPFKRIARSLRNRRGKPVVAGTLLVMMLAVAVPALAQADSVSLSASISGPDRDGLYTVSGTVTPSFPATPQGEIRSSTVSAWLEIMGPAGSWPGEYEWYNHAAGCVTVGDRCATEEELNGVGLVGGGSLVSRSLDEAERGVAIPFEVQITPQEGAASMRVVAQLTHTWRGAATFWDAIHYTWAYVGPVAIEDISPTGLPDDFVATAVAVAAIVAAVIAAVTASAAASAGTGAVAAATAVSPVGGAPTSSFVDPDTGQALPVDGGEVWYGEWMPPDEAQKLIDQRIGEIELDKQAAAQHQQFVSQQQGIREQELKDLGFTYDPDSNTWVPGENTHAILDKRWQDKIAQDPEWQKVQSQFAAIQHELDIAKKLSLQQQNWYLQKDHDLNVELAGDMDNFYNLAYSTKWVADFSINLLGEIPGGPQRIKWAYNSITKMVAVSHEIDPTTGKPYSGSKVLGHGVLQLAEDYGLDKVGNLFKLNKKLTKGKVPNEVWDHSFFDINHIAETWADVDVLMPGSTPLKQLWDNTYWTNAASLGLNRLKSEGIKMFYDGALKNPVSSMINPKGATTKP